MVGNQIYKCAEYKRLSKEDFGKCDESSSISSQGMIIRSFAKHNGLNIVKEYVDDGYSGGNFERPAFSEMIQDIEDGLINCVITMALMMFMLPAGIMDGILATTALILILTQYFGNKKIVK